MLKSSLRLDLKRLTPFIVLAAVIPLLVLLVLSPVKLTFFSQASPREELRVWLEPDVLQLAPGESSEIWVMALFSPENTLLPELQVLVQAEDNMVRLSPSAVRLQGPFNGRVRVGRVTVTASSARGRYTITPIVSLPSDNAGEIQQITTSGTILIN